MPIYEFSCTKCGHQFEKLQKNAGVETVTCPNCGSTEVSKELSSFSATGSSSTTSCNPVG